MGRLDRVQQELKDEVAQFHEVLFHYLSRQWEQGLEILEVLIANSPDTKLYVLYRQRIEYFMANPPEPSWDGVFTHKTK